jgi:hypothetical protein
MTKKLITAVLAGAVVVGVVAFYAGIRYDQSKTAAERQARLQQFGGGGGFGGQRGMRGASGGAFVSGEIIAKDDKSITVKMRDGGSKIIFYSDTTEVGKFVSGALADLEVGKNVFVSGKLNSDGSITAESIQLRPAL